MGGPYNLVFRDIDKKVYAAEIYTRSVCYLLTTVDTLLKKDHILDYVSNEPQTTIAPFGYGIVVVDYVENVILSAQGYGTVFEECWSGFSNSMFTMGRSGELDEKKRLNDLLAYSTKHRLVTNHWDKTKAKSHPIKSKNVDDFLKEFPREKYGSSNIYFKHTPFKVYNKDEDRKGFGFVKKKLKDLGIPVAEEEWDDFVNRHCSEE
jgi:hypothetical protein